MKIKSLKLKNFRNYPFLEFSLGEGPTIFYGDNAQGKTNILEAAYICGTTKSHRGTKDRDIIRFGEEEAHIESLIEKNGLDYKIDIHLKKNSPKGIAINKYPIKKASELFGIVHYVFFSPEDLNIIKNGPSERRRFLDMELSQLDKIYLSHLSNYNRIIHQRNHLLKELSGRESKEKKDMLDIWDMQLVHHGNSIIERRIKFVEEINDIISSIHSNLTGGKESIRLVYESGNGNMTLEEALAKNRERDIRLKSTSVGPHRDDLCFMMKDIDIRRFGSQGQQRTSALSLKLAEIEIVKKEIGDTPILLLDDVLSELDSHRQQYLLKSIHGIQTLITCTGVEEFIKHQFQVHKIFYVKEGSIKGVN